MKVIARQNRDLVLINAQNTQNENDAEKITLQVPEQYEDFNKKIVFITPDGNVWDIIVNNEYLIKKAITKYKQVDFYIWLTKGDVDFRSQTKTLKFYHNVDASNEITDEEIGRVNTVVNLLEEEITKVDNIDINAEKVDNTTTITITDKDGKTKSVEILDGEKGDKGDRGDKGISPSVEISKNGKVTTITITDSTGPHKAIINDGLDGKGVGDMNKSVYDKDDDGIVDNSKTVNGHTVESNVPANAQFTDTIYDDSYIKENIQTNATNIANNTKNIAQKANSTINNNVDVLGTTKSTESIGNNQLLFNKGAIFGGTAMEAGLVTRGICGILTPDSKGGCTKDNLYVNYDGGTEYNPNRQIVIQAGTAGNHYGNNLYQFAAARGDAVKGYVDSAISSAVKGKYTKPGTGIPKTDLTGTVQTSLDKADTAIQSSNFVYDSTTQTLTITTV